MKPKARFTPYTKALRTERERTAFENVQARIKVEIRNIQALARELANVDQIQMQRAYRVHGLKSNRIWLKEPDGSYWPADKPKEHSNV